MTNMMFKRKVQEDLAVWRADPHRKPLVIRGARQVGKSSIVRLFSAGYSRYSELNLEKPEHAGLFHRGLSLHELIQAIQLECKLPVGKDPWLLFLDEIQEVPEAIALLRFFYEERPDIHVIAAGSLLETAMDAAAISFPVGRVQFLHMRPLCFEEYLMAMGEEAALDAWRTVPVPTFAHARLLAHFHTYALTGGMPEAVLRYRETGGDLATVNNVYADLVAAFRDDIAKYGRNETMRRVLLHCLAAAPSQIGSRITFNGFGGSNYKSREVGEALRALERAKLLDLIYPTVYGKEPLMPDYKKSPRLQFLDAGLVNHMAGLQRALIGVRDLADVYRGRLIEQLVGQELKATTTRREVPLVFWVRDKAQANAEVDFLLRTDEGVIPVEVKSGAVGKLRSLHEFIVRNQTTLAVRLYAGKYTRHPMQVGNTTCTLINVPYYAAGLIPQYIGL